MAELKLENVRCSYKDKVVLDDVTFTITDGVVALLGSNGAGKKSRALLRDTFEVTDDMIKEYNIEDYNFLYILAVPENREINGGLHLTASGMLVSGLEVLK